MSKEEHPSIQRHRSRLPTPSSPPLEEQELRRICLDAGVDDLGFLSIDDPALTEHRADIVRLLPETRTVVSVVCRMNRDPVRSVVRSVANQEFHATYDAVNEAARDIVRNLQDQGRRALNAVAAFPMEQENFPGRTWALAHKPIAVAAGLGKMGVHRCVIHPKFGSFILLGTVLLADEIVFEKKTLDYNPCLGCKLCVAVCPVQAIAPNGGFNFSACYNHNYREFLTGFVDWVETIVNSKSVEDYSSRVALNETTSMWQSLSFKPSYKAAFCLAVCPAGDDVLSPFLEDRTAYVERYVKPLQDKKEDVYVLDGSDAQEILKERFPNKRAKVISWTHLDPSGPNLLFTMQLNFQRRKSRGLTGTFHFNFEGRRNVSGTLRVAEQTLEVEFGLHGTPDTVITLPGTSWIDLLARSTTVEGEIESQRIRCEGSIDKLKQLLTCFPKYGPVESPGSASLGPV